MDFRFRRKKRELGQRLVIIWSCLFVFLILVGTIWSFRGLDGSFLKGFISSSRATDTYGIDVFEPIDWNQAFFDLLETLENKGLIVVNQFEDDLLSDFSLEELSCQSEVDDKVCLAIRGEGATDVIYKFEIFSEDQIASLLPEIGAVNIDAIWFYNNRSKLGNPIFIADGFDKVFEFDAGGQEAKYYVFANVEKDRAYDFGLIEYFYKPTKKLVAKPKPEVFEIQSFSVDHLLSWDKKISTIQYGFSSNVVGERFSIKVFKGPAEGQASFLYDQGGFIASTQSIPVNSNSFSSALYVSQGGDVLSPGNYYVVLKIERGSGVVYGLANFFVEDIIVEPEAREEEFLESDIPVEDPIFESEAVEESLNIPTEFNGIELESDEADVEVEKSDFNMVFRGRKFQA